MINLADSSGIEPQAARGEAKMLAMTPCPHTNKLCLCIYNLKAEDKTLRKAISHIGPQAFDAVIIEKADHAS